MRGYLQKGSTCVAKVILDESRQGDEPQWKATKAWNLDDWRGEQLASRAVQANADSTRASELQEKLAKVAAIATQDALYSGPGLYRRMEDISTTVLEPSQGIVDTSHAATVQQPPPPPPGIAAVPAEKDEYFHTEEAELFQLKVPKHFGPKRTSLGKGTVKITRQDSRLIFEAGAIPAGFFEPAVAPRVIADHVLGDVTFSKISSVIQKFTCQNGDEFSLKFANSKKALGFDMARGLTEVFAKTFKPTVYATPSGLPPEVQATLDRWAAKEAAAAAAAEPIEVCSIDVVETPAKPKAIEPGTTPEKVSCPTFKLQADDSDDDEDEDDGFFLKPREVEVNLLSSAGKAHARTLKLDDRAMKELEVPELPEEIGDSVVQRASGSRVRDPSKYSTSLARKEVRNLEKQQVQPWGGSAADAGGHDDHDAGGHDDPADGGHDDHDAGGHDDHDAGGHDDHADGGHDDPAGGHAGGRDDHDADDDDQGYSKEEWDDWYASGGK